MESADVRAYLLFQNSNLRAPRWDMADLYAVASSHKKLLFHHQVCHPDSGNLLDIFQATPFFSQLSNYTAGEASHDILLQLPILEPQDILPASSPYTQRDPSAPEFRSVEGRRHWREIAEQNALTFLQGQVDEGLFADSFENGYRALERMRHFIPDENKRRV